MTTDNVTVSRELLEQAWRELASAGVGLECRAALRAALDAPAVEPVYAFRRKGLDDFCTCSKERFDELSNKPHLFETTTFYAAPQAQPAPVQEQQPVAWVEGRWYEDGTRAGNTLVWASRTADDDFPVGTNLYTAQPRKVVKLSEAEVRSLAKQCDEGGEDNEYLLALSNAIQDAFIAKNRWAE